MDKQNQSLHEFNDILSEDTQNMHRALVSLQEELDAVDWYQQRADASKGELKDIFIHNMHEEIEHACMLLEWLRRNNLYFDKNLQTYLFTQGSITELESSDETT